MRGIKSQIKIMDFKAQLKNYQEQINLAAGEFSRELLAQSEQDCGEQSTEVLSALTSILNRGGKRLRGALAMWAYQTFADSAQYNQQNAVQLALAIELMHAYILMVDDIQDRSDTRRGGPAAHKILEKFVSENFDQKDLGHRALALTLNAALCGSHLSNQILSSLQAGQGIRVQLIKEINQTMYQTAQGQSGDILSEISGQSSEQDVLEVMDFKTGRYSIASPLKMGLILSQNSLHEDTEFMHLIDDFARSVGRMFQAVDDYLGVFGAVDETGKSNKDDLSEGKQTLLVVWARENIELETAEFLNGILGQKNISDSDLEKVQQIMKSSGVVQRLEEFVEQNAKSARQTLQKISDKCPEKDLDFLSQLVDYLAKRKA